MPQTHPRYPVEFRRQLVELVRAGRTPEELSLEFEPSVQTIRTWAHQADLDGGRRKNGLTSDEREELRRLRRENRQLRQEREILAKAAAWLARETDSIPSGSMSSVERIGPCIALSPLCRVLDVSPSGYYAWRRRAPCARSCADQALTECIQAIHERSRGTYGARRASTPSW